MIIWKVSYYNNQNQLIIEEKYFGAKEQAEAYAISSGPNCSYYTVTDEYIPVKNLQKDALPTLEEIKIRQEMQNLWIEKASIFLLGCLFLLAVTISIWGTFYIPTKMSINKAQDQTQSKKNELTVDGSSFAWAKTFINTLSGVCIGILLRGRLNNIQERANESDKRENT